jgi:hypothetical protein
MRAGAGLFRIAVEFGTKRHPRVRCYAPQVVDFVPFNHAAGRSAFADYWNFTAPLWVSADTGGVQFIENFRLRHLGWEFP